MYIDVLIILFWTSVLAPVYAYLGYPLMLFACGLFARRQASRPDDSFVPSVSIILAAHNEVQHIAAKLENCLSLEYPQDKLQILVGSDGSDDGTNEILQQYRQRGIIAFEFSERRGKMATVNRLVKEASGEIGVFSDISELFDQDAIRSLVRHFADPRIGAVTGNHIYHRADSSLGRGTSFYWKFQRFLQQIESRIFSVFACDGTIYACRREWFPFPSDQTINDDVAVPLGVISIGKRVIFEPRAIARGDVLAKTERFFRQKIRSQAGKYQNFAQFPNLLRPWPLSRFWIYISHSVLPVIVPWFLVAAWIFNLALAASGTSPYGIILACQIAFYLLAAMGWIADVVGVRIPLSAVPFYFVAANVGSLFGFFHYRMGIQQVAWKKVD